MVLKVIRKTIAGTLTDRKFLKPFNDKPLTNGKPLKRNKNKKNK